MKKTYLKVGILLSMLFTTAVSYANVPSWLIGKWADGNIIVEITSDSKMSIYERDILIKEGSFTFDNNGFIETQWDKDLKPDDEYYFCFSDLSESQWFAHEGGDKLTKLPENTISNDNKSQEKDYSGKLDSHIFVENPQRCWKNISWVYGEWRIPANHPSGKTYAVKITPFYYQATNNIAESGAVDFSGLSKKWYKAMQGQHSLLGDVIYIDDLYFDLTAKRIYQSNLDRKIYLEQTVEYTTTKAKVIFGVIACILGIGILLGLYFLIRKLIRIIIFNAKRVATWIKTKWDNIKLKSVSAIKKASATTKEQWEVNVKPKAKSTIKKVSANAKEQWEENVKPMASSALNRISEEMKVKTDEVKDKTMETKVEVETIETLTDTTASTNTNTDMKTFGKNIVTFVICVWMLSKCMGCGESGMRSDGRNYIRSIARDPSSVEFVSYTSAREVRALLKEEWNIDLDDKYDIIIFDIEATNGFGGRNRESYAVFYVDGEPKKHMDASEINGMNIRTVIEYLDIE